MPAEPFRHWVMDEYLPADSAKACADAFSSVGEYGWRVRSHAHSLKWTLAPPGLLPQAVSEQLADLIRPAHLTALETLTEIPDLRGDPSHVGGGMHQSRPGSFLDLHADFLTHPETGLRRVLNLLIYLSPDWESAWGGHLELWDARMRRCVQRIEPIFNRAVLFETSPTSFHGHPDPMTGPPWARRNSLALYYYRPYRPGEPVHRGSTDYRARPWEYGKRLRAWAGRSLRKVGLK